jgi:hypothetical protein
VRSLLLFTLVSTSGCATWRGTHPELAALETALGGKALRAQCALRRAGMADDPTRDLALPHPVNARILIVNRNNIHHPLHEKFRRITPGSVWRLKRISGPGGTEAWLRPLRSPRHLIWIELRRGAERIIVAVPEVLKDAVAMSTWFAEQFAIESPPGWEGLAGPKRDALRAGRVSPGLSPNELRIARCAPDEVIVDASAQPTVERWIYLNQTGVHEMAVLLGGKTVGGTTGLTDSDLKTLRTGTKGQSKP